MAGSVVSDFIATVKQTFGIGIKSKRATLDASALTAARTYALQDAAGTLAMTGMSATQRVRGRNSAGAGDQEEVTLSQLLDWIGSASRGDILFRDASTWARLAAGTAGYHLQTAGSGGSPLWVQPNGPLLATATASSTATIDFNFTNWTQSNFIAYLLKVENVAPAKNAVQMYLRTSANGTTFDSGASNYGWTCWDYGTGSFVNGDTQIKIGGTTTGAGNAANYNSSGAIWIGNPNASLYGKIISDFAVKGSDGFIRRDTAAGERFSAAQINGIRFMFSSGNIASGEFRLYGLTNT